MQRNQQNGVALFFAKTLDLLLFFRTCQSVSPDNGFEVEWSEESVSLSHLDPSGALLFPC